MAEAQSLRIVHCFRSPIGGIFRHVRDLAEQHSAAGHQVGILCDSSTGGAHEDRLFDQIMPFLSLGVTRFPIGRSVGLGDMAALIEAYKLIKELQPDILHGHGAKGGVIARLIGSLLRVRRYRVARLYSPHGGSLHFSSGSLSGQGVFMAERILERMTESISFVCDYERATYETKIGKPHSAATRIYNGISERDFGRIPVEAEGVDFAYIGMLRDISARKHNNFVLSLATDALANANAKLEHKVAERTADLQRLQALLSEAQRPLVVLGGGGWTAAAGSTFIYSAQLPPRLQGMAMVCEPTMKLIGLMDVQPDGAGYVAKDAYSLVASSDEWMSPVYAEVGPDGAIYITNNGGSFEWLDNQGMTVPGPTPASLPE